MSTIAITRVFGDGQKLVAVAIEYERPIRSAGLGVRAFSVDERTVTKVSANDEPAIAPSGKNGRYVIVELSVDDDAAATWRPIDRHRPLVDERGAPRGPRVGDDDPTGVVIEPRATVRQLADIVAVDGTRYPADPAAHHTERSVDPIVDEFEQYEFRDPRTGRTLRYNLFVPSSDRRGKRYPLVLFLHDAGAIARDTKGPLVQGLGAVCWASPDDRAAHECLVVAPQFDAVVVDDRYLPSDLSDTALHLLEDLVTRFDVDRSRIYATGQSMGAMLVTGMAIEHPRLFAATLVVGGQWPADRTAPLATTRLWVTVSEGDAKAFPEQNATMRRLEAAGATVATTSVDGSATPERLDAHVRGMLRADANINYLTFRPGTIARGGATDPLSEHTATWQLAYAIPEIRHWLMAQTG